MKLITRTLACVLLLVVALLCVGLFAGGPMIRAGILLVAPRLLNVPVSVRHVAFSPLQGHAAITGLTIGNPEGFSSNHLLQVQHLQIELVTRSLFTDTLRIRKILLEAPRIHYEWIGTRSNIGVLVETLESDPEDPQDSPKTTKTTIIDELRISAPVIQLSARRTGRTPLKLAPGDIVLTNLGGPDQSTAQIIARILTAIATTSINVAESASLALDDGVRSAAGSVSRAGRKTAEAVTKGAKSAARGIGSLFRGSRGRRQQEADEEQETLSQDIE